MKKTRKPSAPRDPFDHDWRQPPASGFIDPWKAYGRAVFRAVFGLQATGLEHLPERGPYILASNHPSYLDPLFVGAFTHRLPMRIMTWNAVFRMPIVGTWSRLAGAFPIDLSSPRGAIRATRIAEEILETGGILLIFPEGGRSEPGGRMKPFKPGVGRLAARIGCPVIPVSVLGSWRVWPHHHLVFRPGKVRVHFHPAFTLDAAERATRERDRDYHTEIAARIEAQVFSLVEPVRVNPRTRTGFIAPPSS